MHTIKPNDYGYASSGCRNGEETLDTYDKEECKSTNWLYNGNYQWLLSPREEYRHWVTRVRSEENDGDVSATAASIKYSVRPIVYLKAEVKITSGEGTLENPYSLSL